MTHRPKPEWVEDHWPVTFVTDGLESAINEAKRVAGKKSVAIASATIAQHCLNAGLLDEIRIDLVPFLLGDGISLFAHLKATPIALDGPEVTIGKRVTHLTLRVVK
jgi:dihydrofolate reductase